MASARISRLVIWPSWANASSGRPGLDHLRELTGGGGTCRQRHDPSARRKVTAHGIRGS